jgi:hypothetical protein
VRLVLWVGPLTDKQKQVVVVIEVARIEAFVHMWPGLQGRPPADRHAIARAFVAKPRPCSGCRRRTCSSSGSSPTRRCVGSVVGNTLDRCRAKRRSRAPSPSSPKAVCRRKRGFGQSSRQGRGIRGTAGRHHGHLSINQRRLRNLDPVDLRHCPCERRTSLSARVESQCSSGSRETRRLSAAV